MAPTSPVRNNTHTPRVSSPLSPGQTVDEQQTCRVVRRRSRKPNTLCARLLKARAQESWRNHVLSAQVAQHETVQAIRSPEQKPMSPPKSHPVHLNFSLDRNQRFRLGDLSNRMTRRLLYAMGFVGVAPAQSVPRYLPQTMPILAS